MFSSKVYTFLLNSSTKSSLITSSLLKRNLSVVRRKKTLLNSQSSESSSIIKPATSRRRVVKADDDHNSHLASSSYSTISPTSSSIPPSSSQTFNKDFLIPNKIDREQIKDYYLSAEEILKSGKNKILKYPLQYANGFEQDNLINFDKDSHTYYYQGKVLDLSVTQFISRFFVLFNRRKVINEMMQKPDWPRPEYTHPDGSPYKFEDIIEKWNDISRESSSLGSLLHSNIENFLNGFSLTNFVPSFKEEVEAEVKQFLTFYEKHIYGEKIIPFRTEWVIGDSSLSLGGSIDFVGVREDGTFILMDWKRSERLYEKISPDKILDGPSNYYKKSDFEKQARLVLIFFNYFFY